MLLSQIAYVFQLRLSHKKLVRSGYVYFADGYLSLTGINGYDWSSTSYSTANYIYARTLNFFERAVYPSARDARFHGFPLRCLVVGKV